MLPKVLADSLGISVDLLSKYETGKLDNPTTSTLMKFGEALGVSIDYFVSDYMPVDFILRQDLIDLADKLAMLPQNERNQFKRHIQADYNALLVINGNKPVHLRRSGFRNKTAPPAIS